MLADAIARYVDLNHSIGMRFQVDEAILKAFHRHAGEVDLAAISPDVVVTFLKPRHRVQARACRVTTRNQRLAALHSFARFIGARSPEHLAWCSEICSIPFKKATHEGVCYLEKPEMDALLGAPDLRTRQGFRDHTLLLFLYNSGARASEAVGVTVGDLDLPDASQASVRLMGKGSKVRRCPLWASTAGALKTLIGDRPATAAVFVNRRGHALTRYGVHDLVARYGRTVAHRMLSPRSLAGSIVTRSLRPLPSRTVMSFRRKSRSLTLNRQHSRRRKPEP